MSQFIFLEIVEKIYKAPTSEQVTTFMTETFENTCGSLNAPLHKWSPLHTWTEWTSLNPINDGNDFELLQHYG